MQYKCSVVPLPPAASVGDPRAGGCLGARGGAPVPAPDAKKLFGSLNRLPTRVVPRWRCNASRRILEGQAVGITATNRVEPRVSKRLLSCRWWLAVGADVRERWGSAPVPLAAALRRVRTKRCHSDLPLRLCCHQITTPRDPERARGSRHPCFLHRRLGCRQRRPEPQADTSTAPPAGAEAGFRDGC